MPTDTLVAETYDAQYAVTRNPVGDQAFYAAFAARHGGPVLELGCGTGRVLLPIARTGLPCTGVDPSTAMLRSFRAKDPPDTVTLVQSTMQALDLRQRDFACATIPFRAFQHVLAVDDQLEALVRIRDHLRPGGHLALDVFEPHLARLATEAEAFVQETIDWNGRRFARHVVVTRDHVRQVQEVRFHFIDVDTDEELGIETTFMRWFYRYELEHLLARAGFVPVRWSSDFTGGAYVAAGDIVVECVRA